MKRWLVIVVLLISTLPALAQGSAQANDEGHGYAKKKNLDFLFYATIMFVRQFLLGEQAQAAGQ